MNFTKSIQPNISFVSLPLGEELNQIWDLLEKDLWKTVAVQSFIKNTKRGELEREKWEPVLDNILPLFQGMHWSRDEKKIFEPCFLPTIQPSTIDDFLLASQQFFESFSNKHIGVQLSGGLDSSLIIALLIHNKIPFSLVGMTSERYEFRSEKVIQQLYATKGKNTILLDYEKYLPFNELELVPPHQYPDLFSINYAANKAMAEAGQKLGIDILLTGSGGDNVFAESISNNPKHCSWKPKGFIEGWLNDLIYLPHGVELIPFYADTKILNTLYNMRLGELEDNRKLWARNFFKDFLPTELTDYSYCADFWGLYISGLENSMSSIKKLCANAFELTKNPSFSKERIDTLFGGDILDAKKSLYQEIESVTAIAVWLNTLNIKEK